MGLYTPSMLYCYAGSSRYMYIGTTHNSLPAPADRFYHSLRFKQNINPITTRHFRAPEMDPITAFSVACGAIQVIDFGIRTASEVYEVTKSAQGLSKKNARLQEQARSLDAMIQALRGVRVLVPIHGCRTQ